MNASTVLKVQLKKLHPAAIIPKFQTAGAAGFDLHYLPSAEPVRVYPGHTLKISTGIAVSIGNPEWGLFIFPRSGLGSKGLRLANCVGVIDSDYQGELVVMMANDSDEIWEIQPGDRIAQGVFMPVRQAMFVEVEQFSYTTERGDKGFGSTGVGA